MPGQEASQKLLTTGVEISKIPSLPEWQHSEHLKFLLFSDYVTATIKILNLTMITS